MTSRASVEQRVDALAWDELRGQLDTRGFAVTAPLLRGRECEELSDLFDGGRFRSTIDMARHRFGDVFFPFQILTVLSEPLVDYEGGQFVLVEQRPRAQSRAHVLEPPRGAFVIVHDAR